MIKFWKKTLTVVLCAAITVSAGSCGRRKKEPKPEPKATPIVDEGNTDANGKGDGQSDIPLVVGCSKLDKKFNPFIKKGRSDKRAVDFTQIYLVTNDRNGDIIHRGIDGEVREYNGDSYTYYGPANIEVSYDEARDKTTYKITLRDDISFSDGVNVTIDDVIFSIYAFCDNSYKGDIKLSSQSIEGLQNYRMNNSRFESVSDKNVRKYIKKNASKIKKWSKKNKLHKKDYDYKKKLYYQVRKWIAGDLKKKGKAKPVKNIKGIKRISNYSMSLTTYGYNESVIEALKIPICPLHYYGDETKYDYFNNKFGFKRGDISAVRANKTSPMGAGAYRFVKYENDIIYYTSNEIYYKGCPKIAYLQLKDMDKLLKEKQEEIQQYKDKGELDINEYAAAVEMSAGTMDVFEEDIPAEDIRWITQINSNGDIDGNKLSVEFFPNGSYEYIGINKETVKVGKSPYNRQSVALRKVFATVFSAYKSEIEKAYGVKMKLIDYPCDSSSWIYPDDEDENYSVAYNEDYFGGIIYKAKDAADDKTEKLLNAVTKYLQIAGFSFENGRIKRCPVNVEPQFEIIIAGGEDNPIYNVITAGSEFFEKIGITLNIIPANDESEVMQIVKQGKHQMWAGTFSPEVGFFDKYAGKDSVFGLEDEKITEFAYEKPAIYDKSVRKEKYLSMMNYLRKFVIEVPINELQETVMYSSARIKKETMTQEVTKYYDWSQEIQNIEMK